MLETMSKSDVNFAFSRSTRKVLRMSAITPYSKYSTFQHTTASELITKNSAVVQTLFPVSNYYGPKISALFINTSIESCTLILGNTLSFANLINSCDPLREILPVIFDCSCRDCSQELLQAVIAHGKSIQGSPELVAIQIDLDNRGEVTKFFFPCYSNEDPHSELARLIRGEVSEVFIDNYRLKSINDTWVPPNTNPQWQGLAFEQSSRVIRAWLHAPNPNALQGAKNDAQRKINKATQDLQRINTRIQTATAAGRYNGLLDRESNEIKQALQKHQNHLAYLTAQTVNSASKPTLQTAITIQVGQTGKLQLLERRVCQDIATLIDRAIEKVPWETLQIGTVAIENLIHQKLNALVQKVAILAANHSEEDWSGTDWEWFDEEVLAERKVELRQTYQQFCQKELGHPVPTAAEKPGIDAKWKTALSERLKWVTVKLRAVDEDLKKIERYTFTAVDINIFEDHRQRMVQVLKRANLMAYELGVELKEKYAERDLLRNAVRNHQFVHLVKRVAEGGDILWGVTKTPRNPTDRPDPNNRKNEVHVPVTNLKDPNPNRPYTPPTLKTDWRQYRGLMTVGAVAVLAIYVLGKRYGKSKT